MARSKGYRHYSKLLTNSSSSSAMNVNGSSTPVSFTLTPPASVTVYVYELILTVHSTGMDFSSASELRNFGAVGAALTTGVTVFESKGSPAVNVDLLPSPWKRMADTYRYTSWVNGAQQLVAVTDSIAAGTDLLTLTLSWDRDHPIVLTPNNNGILTVKVSDNLTSLALFEAHAIGTQSKY